MHSSTNITDVMGGANSPAAAYVSIQAGGTNVFTIAATGYKDDEKKGYSITATVELQEPHKYQYLYYRSPSEGM
jgi:hypothetical protein